MNFKKLFYITAAALFLTGCDTNLRPYMIISPEATMAEFQEAMRFTPPDDGSALLFIYRQKEDEQDLKEGDFNYNLRGGKVVLDRRYRGMLKAHEFTVLKLEPGSHQIASDRCFNDLGLGSGEPRLFEAQAGDMLFYEMAVTRHPCDTAVLYPRKNEEITGAQRLMKRGLVMVKLSRTDQ